MVILKIYLKILIYSLFSFYFKRKFIMSNKSWIKINDFDQPKLISNLKLGKMTNKKIVKIKDYTEDVYPLY